MKRILVASGGANKFAWEVGAAYFLAKTLNRKYDGYCGISAGALLAGIYALHKNPLDAAHHSKKLLNEVTTSKIHKRWFPFGKFHGLWKPSFLNSQPLNNWIKKIVSEDKLINSEKELRVGGVSLTTGEYKLWTEDDDDITEGIAASSAFPVMFLPIKTREQLWLDGGVRHITPIRSAIVDLQADEIDVLITGRWDNVSPIKKKPNAIDVALKSLEIMLDQIMASDVKQAQFYNRLIRAGVCNDKSKRDVKMNILTPKKPIKYDSLSFEPEIMQKMFAQGIADGKGMKWNVE